MDDPLTILVSEENVDRQKLADVLSGFVGIEQDGKIFLKQLFFQLDAAKKIQALLLAAKARFLLKLSETECLSPKEVVSLSKLPEGTVKSTLKRLKENGFILVRDALYSFPNYRIDGFWSEVKPKGETH